MRLIACVELIETELRERQTERLVFFPFISWNLLRNNPSTMSKRTRSGKNTEASTTTKRVNIEHDNILWRIVTDHPDIFDTHIVTKLNGNDVKFFYDVNPESRAAIKRSGAHLPDAFKIGDFDTKPTISWALEKCSENKKARFCAYMALNGNLELLTFLHEERCPWDFWTCSYAAKYGHLECLKYARENRCPWGPLGKWNMDTRSYEDTCSNAAENGQLECLKYANDNGCPWDGKTCSGAAYNGHLECLKYAHENECPWDKHTCFLAAQNGHLECLKYAHDNGCPGSSGYAHHLPRAQTHE